MSLTKLGMKAFSRMGLKPGDIVRMSKGTRILIPCDTTKQVSGVKQVLNTYASRSESSIDLEHAEMLTNAVGRDKANFKKMYLVQCHINKQGLPKHPDAKKYKQD